MQHSGTKRLETDRLILRKLTLNDAFAAFKNWTNDRDVTKYLTWPVHEHLNTTQKVIRDWVNRYEQRDFYQWAIVLKENGDEPIGTISVVKKDDNTRMVQIGYCIGKKWWHQGITTEALSALIRYFFQEVNVNRIEARHDPNNQNSGKVMLKCGMKFEGILRQADRNNQGICDAAMYAILAEDYS